MKRIIIIPILFLSFFSFSQDWLEDKENLNGKVKSVNYKSILFFGDQEEDWWTENNIFEYNLNGFLIRHVLSVSIDGSWSNSIFRVFDKDELLCLEEYVVYENDTSSRYVFEYDSLRKTKKVILFSDGYHWSTFNYFYNDKGLVKECFTVIQRNNDTIRNLYEYDEYGHKVKDSDLSSSCIVIKTWKYDLLGNIIEEKSELIKAPGTTIVTIENDGTRSEKRLDKNPDDDRNYQINYSYNSKNQVDHMVEKYLDGRIKNDIIYEYNQSGDVIAEYRLIFGEETEERYKRSIAYEYDSNGNWIKKNTTSNVEVDREEKREIIYYP